MAFQVANNLRFRRSFGRIRKIIDLPYLIEIQKNSYELFLQKDAAPTERQAMGLQEVFKSVFPIKDFNETASLEFVSYTLGEPKYDVEECHQRGMTFAAPLKVTVQLVLWDVDQQTGARSIKNVKEQEVYFGEVPLMTINGTFMINGTERVIVSQLHRSPGVFFEHDKGKTHASGKLLYSARVIPYRGSWVDLEFDPRDVVYVRIDRRRKFHATVLLRALGMTPTHLEVREIVREFDKNKSGTIEFGEFLELYAKYKAPPSSSAQLLEAFKVFDKKNTGKINTKDLTEALTTLGDPLPEGQVKELFATLDPGNSGSVDIAEFVAFLTKGNEK